jgi:DNA-binding NtrC family response regulator
MATHDAIRWGSFLDLDRELSRPKLELVAQRRGDMRILYVEDGDGISDCQSRTAQNGCELEVAAGSRDAITRIEECGSDRFDLAVAGLSVPDSECVKVIRYMREHRFSLPVIVNAKEGDDGRILAVSGAGADVCIIKGSTDVDRNFNYYSLPMKEGVSGQAQQAVPWPTERVLEAMVRSLPIRIIVLDRNGVISYESKKEAQTGSWAGPPAGSGLCGSNYLASCERAVEAGDDLAARALEGIRLVLSGSIPRFGLEYGNGESAQQGWCLMQVDRMPPDHGGVVISYTDISEPKEAETSLRSAMAELEQLKNQLQQENVYLQQEIKLEHFPDHIIGESKALGEVLRKVEQVSPTDSTVLIVGETGTGKELIARAIHSASRRRERPLVKVDCAALPAALIESELFGHEKGAFTGAQARKIGRFELANGATLLLDEIGELPPDLQAKLVRVLQEGEFERLGSSNTIKLNVRVIAATNRDLKQDVLEGRFRADLWYRLNVFPITMPPLRDRRQDLRLLVKHFAAKFSQRAGKRFAAIAPAAVKAIEEYDWPGNVRELASVIERAVIVSPGPVLTLADSLSAGTHSRMTPEERRTLEEIERESILDRLEETRWKIDGAGGAAESLGINPSTLRSRMIKLGIRAPQKRYARHRLQSTS